MKNQKDIELMQVFIIVSFFALNFVFVFGTLFGGFQEFQAKLEIKNQGPNSKIQMKEIKNEEMRVINPNTGEWFMEGTKELEEPITKIQETNNVNEDERLKIKDEEVNSKLQIPNYKEDKDRIKNQFVFGTVVELVSDFFASMGDYLGANFFGTGGDTGGGTAINEEPVAENIEGTGGGFVITEGDPTPDSPPGGGLVFSPIISSESVQYPLALEAPDHCLTKAEGTSAINIYWNRANEGSGVRIYYADFDFNSGQYGPDQLYPGFWNSGASIGALMSQRQYRFKIIYTHYNSQNGTQIQNTCVLRDVKPKSEGVLNSINNINIIPGYKSFAVSWTQKIQNGNSRINTFSPENIKNSLVEISGKMAGSYLLDINQAHLPNDKTHILSIYEYPDGYSAGAPYYYGESTFTPGLYSPLAAFANSNVVDNNISLSWRNVPGINKYRIIKHTKGDDYFLNADSGTQQMVTLEDNGLWYGEMYSYEVRSEDPEQIGSYSPSPLVFEIKTGPAPAPSGFTATSSEQQPRILKFSWGDNFGRNIRGYEIWQWYGDYSKPPHYYPQGYKSYEFSAPASSYTTRYPSLLYYGLKYAFNLKTVHKDGAISPTYAVLQGVSIGNAPAPTVVGSPTPYGAQNALSFSWNPVPGAASSYVITRGFVPLSSDYTGETYNESNLNYGTTYSYSIYPKHFDGTTSTSFLLLSGTTGPAPSATAFSYERIPNTRSLKFNWTDNLGSYIGSYELRRHYGNGIVSYWVPAPADSRTIPPLYYGIKYAFDLKAIHKDGNPSPNQVALTNVSIGEAPAPAPSSTPHYTIGFPRSLKFSWKPVSSITKYKIERQGTAGSKTFEVSVTAYEDYPLEYKENYRYRIYPIHADGSESGSYLELFGQTGDAPSATSFSYERTTDPRSLKFRWDDSALGSTIGSYQIWGWYGDSTTPPHYYPQGYKSYEFPAPASSHVINGLHYGLDYAFDLYNVHKNGTIAPTPAKPDPVSVSIGDAPSPTGGSIRPDPNGLPNSLKLTWSPVDTITHYKIMRGDSVLSGSSAGTTFIERNLAFSRSYLYKIYPVHPYGDKNASVNFLPLAATTGGVQAPTVSINGSWIDITWDSINGAQGYNIRRYIVGSYDLLDNTFGSSGQSFTNSNKFEDKVFLPNTRYKYQVKPDNTTAWPDTYSGIISTSLYPPSSITVSIVGQTAISVSWGSPTTNPGLVQGYRIQRFGSDGTSAISELGATSFSLIHNELAYNTAYSYKIASVAGTYTSALSPFSSVVTTKPQAPTITGLVNEGAGLKLSWSGTNGASYTVQRFVKQGNNFNTNGATSNVSTASFINTGLTTGSIYKYSVITNLNGQSSLSTMSPEGMAGLIAPSSISLYSIPTGGIGVSWNSVAGASSYSIVRQKWVYDLDTCEGFCFRDDTVGVFSFSTSNNSFLDFYNSISGFRYGEKYKYTVATKINGWTSSPGFSSGSLVAVPPKPSNFNGYLNYFNGVNLGWSEISGITNYSLFRYDNGATNPSYVYNVAGTNFSMSYGEGAGSIKRGMNYKFGLKAMGVNNVGSEMVSINMTTPPNSPNNVSAKVVPTGIKIGWDAVSGADKYKVTRSWKNICSEDPIQNDLVAHYKFDDLYNIGREEINSSNNATNYGGMHKYSEFNMGVNFEAPSSYLQINSIQNLANYNKGTIAFWFKNSNLNPNYQNIFYIIKGPDDFLRFEINNSQIRVKLYMGINQKTLIINNWNKEAKWYLLTLTQDGQGVKVYLDGEEKASDSYTGWIHSLISSGNQIAIGKSDASNNYYKGELDEFKIYNKAIPSNRIRELYECGNPYILTTTEKIDSYQGETGHSGVRYGDSYFYQVKAVKNDIFQSEISSSNKVTITPLAPNNFTGSEVVEGIRLNWDAPYGTESYKIRRNWNETCLDTSPKLVSHFDFDQDDLLFSTNGTSFTGALNNQVLKAPYGVYGFGASFDGVDDYLFLGNATPLESSNKGAISLWVKFGETAKTENIFRIGPDSENDSLKLIVDNQKIVVLAKEGSAQKFLIEEPWVRDQNWHLITINNINNGTNASSVEFYLDGAKRKEVSGDGWWLYKLTNQFLYLGTSSTNTNNFTGKIDDLKLYNDVLNASEIAETYRCNKYIHVNGGVSTPSYLDSYANGLVAGTSYTYTVWSVNDGGESEPSTSASITPANFRGVKGKIYYDFDGNGQFAGSEKEISYAVVTLWKKNGSTYTSVTDQTIEPSGAYSFDGLISGSGYALSVNPKMLGPSGVPMTTVESNLYTTKGAGKTMFTYEGIAILGKNIGLHSLNTDRIGAWGSGLVVNGIDLAVVLNSWEQVVSDTAKNYIDLDYDGTINGIDLAKILGQWEFPTR